MSLYVCALAALEQDGNQGHKLNLAPCMIQADDQTKAHYKALRTVRKLFPIDNGYFGHNVVVVKAENSIADIDDPNFQILQHESDSMDVIPPDDC